MNKKYAIIVDETGDHDLDVELSEFADSELTFSTKDELLEVLNDNFDFDDDLDLAAWQEYLWFRAEKL